MTFVESFRPAWANLRANPIRAFFSMLGIIIGTGSVILVVSIVSGTKDATIKEMLSGSENMITVNGAFDPSNNNFGRISLGDVEAVKKVPGVFTAFPEVNRSAEARGTFGKANLELMGVDETYDDLYELILLSGKFFDAKDVHSRSRTCVISDKLAKDLYGFDYPIGQRLRMKEGSLEVIGVFKEEERLLRMGQRANSFVSYYTLTQLFDIKYYAILQIRSYPGKINEVERDISPIFNLEKGDYSGYEMRDHTQYVKEAQEWAQKWLYQLVAIAGISLFVGGIGLMNVMLTTVAERTQEIGVRKAIGADSRAILMQFLFESVTLSVIGGVAGIFIGIIGSYAVNVFSKGTVFISISYMAILASFLFSMLTGIFFGLFPASKASRLTPVEALRYE